MLYKTGLGIGDLKVRSLVILLPLSNQAMLERAVTGATEQDSELETAFFTPRMQKQNIIHKATWPDAYIVIMELASKWTENRMGR